MRRLVISVAMLGACSGGPGGSGPDGGTEPDGNTESPDARPEPPNVRVDAFGVQFIAYRDGTGPWQTPELIAANRYGLRVTDDYQLVMACSDDTGFEALLYAWTLSEGASQFAFCSKADPSATTVAVTGDMVQAGSVSMGDVDSSATGPWSFALDVAPGLHDLIGTSSGGILIRRNERIVAATAVDTIDVAEDGVALIAVPLTLNGVEPNDAITTNVLLLTGNDGASITATGPTALTPPDSILEGNDFRILIVTAETETSRRETATGFSGAQTVFTLLPALTGVTFTDTDGGVTASWGTVPDFSDLELTVYSSEGSRFSTQMVLASEAWIEATGATALSFDASAPGYDPTWRIDLTGPYTRSLGAFSQTGPISYLTAAVERLNGAMAGIRPSGAHRAEALANRRTRRGILNR